MSRFLSKNIAHITQTLSGIPQLFSQLFPTNWTSGSNIATQHRWMAYDQNVGIISRLKE